MACEQHIVAALDQDDHRRRESRKIHQSAGRTSLCSLDRGTLHLSTAATTKLMRFVPFKNLEGAPRQIEELIIDQPIKGPQRSKRESVRSVRIIFEFRRVNASAIQGAEIIDTHWG